jgi:hypothetical protein
MLSAFPDSLGSALPVYAGHPKISVFPTSHHLVFLTLISWIIYGLGDGFPFPYEQGINLFLSCFNGKPIFSRCINIDNIRSLFLPRQKGHYDRKWTVPIHDIALNN